VIDAALAAADIRAAETLILAGVYDACFARCRGKGGTDHVSHETIRAVREAK